MLTQQAVEKTKEKLEKILFNSETKPQEDIQAILSLIDEEKQKVAEDICIIIDKIESTSQTNTLEEWKQYKHIRNAIRDKYVINSQEK